MAVFTVYTKADCPWCERAKETLTKLGHDVNEHPISDPTILREFHSRAPGARTVPQIFVGQYRIGGYTDLAALIDQGTFDLIVEANS